MTACTRYIVSGVSHDEQGLPGEEAAFGLR
jgi:hypothetical protein